jgi:Flp pilus assembly pilin Flp
MPPAEQLLRKGGDQIVSIPLVASAMRALFARDDEAGQGLAEYALILALIAITAIIAMLFLGSQISDKFSVIGSTINSVTP